MQTPTLETERLILRPLLVSDAESVFLWTSDERVTKYMLYPRHENIEVTLEWLKSIDHNSETAYDFGFLEKESGLLIGSGGLYWEDGNRQWRIGYNLRFDRWGHGYATEAAREIMRFAVDELSAERIGSEHAVGNPASGRVLEKCGLTFTKYGEYTKFDGSVTFQCKEYGWEKG